MPRATHFAAGAALAPSGARRSGSARSAGQSPAPRASRETSRRRCGRAIAAPASGPALVPTPCVRTRGRCRSPPARSLFANGTSDEIRHAKPQRLGSAGRLAPVREADDQRAARGGGSAQDTGRTGRAGQIDRCHQPPCHADTAALAPRLRSRTRSAETIACPHSLEHIPPAFEPDHADVRADQKKDRSLDDGLFWRI